MTAEQIDIGHGHLLTFVGWHPDRELNPQYQDIEDVERWGADIEHPAGPKGALGAYDDPKACVGFVTFDGPAQQRINPRAPKWQVESWDPLTISPSVLCDCGDHGFIRDGRWVPA